MEDLFIIYTLYPCQSFGLILFGVLISFITYRIKAFLGVVVAFFAIVSGSWLILSIGGSLEQIYAAAVMPVILLFSALVLLFPRNKGKGAGKKENIMLVEMLDDRKKKHFISDLNRGVAIFGSSGAGKSASVIFFLMKHLSKHNFAGIINDYKDYELSEIAYPLFMEHGITFKVFAIHDVNRSVRINILDPRYIPALTDLSGIVSSLMINLSGDSDSGTSKFFRESAESLLCGVIWRLRKDYPQNCNLPFVIALLLSSENLHDKVINDLGIEETIPFARLVRFLKEDREAEIAASVFLSAMANERQIAAVYSTLAASLRTLASPEVFYLLEESDISLDLNEESNRMVLSFINKPGALENVISPINAMIIEGCFSSMSKRGRKPSFILLDEAPTIKIPGLGRRIATLRSYGVSFIYCMQDKIQGMAQWGGKEYMIKEILTNLSTQFMGKANDADTAKYYEKFFEIVKEDQRSISKGESTWFSRANRGEIRVTTSQKEKTKVRGYEFFRLRQGEFIMFADGIDDKFRFYYEPPLKRLPALSRSLTSAELQENFSRILNLAGDFLK